MKRFSITAWLLLFSFATLLAAPPVELQRDIDSLIQAAHIDGGQIGISIVSLRDGQLWYQKDETRAFIPASTTKLVTTALALQKLSVDYQFSTRLFTNGRVNEIVDGVLHGDLILQGGGDPLLSPMDLSALAMKLSSGNALPGIPPIKVVKGKILAEETFFPCAGPLLGKGWEKGDLPWYYAAPANALSCSRNALTIIVEGTRDGEPALISIIPATRIFTIVHQVNTRANVTTGNIDVTVNGTQLVINGRIAPGAKLAERISIPDPACFTLEQFKFALQQAGISVEDDAETIGKEGQQRELLGSISSAKLPEILTAMLKPSDNMIAEQLFWTIQCESPELRYDEILASGMNNWQAIAGSMRVVDGSGLSRLNSITPQSMSGLLTSLYHSQYFPIVWQALPIAGVDGTLSKRMKNSAAADNVRAKTGTMSGVCCLAGYVTTRQREPLVLVVFNNGYRGGSGVARGLQDNIAAYLAGL